jgi:hypothetical protein
VLQLANLLYSAMCCPVLCCRYFLRKLRKVKKANGQILACNEVSGRHFSRVAPGWLRSSMSSLQQNGLFPSKAMCSMRGGAGSLGGRGRAGRASYMCILEP